MRSDNTHARTSRGGDDLGGIVSGWLIRLIILMAILGFVGYEFISAIATTFQLDGIARDVAVAAADRYGQTDDLDDARTVAAATAEELGAVFVDLVVEGQSVRVTVTDTAETFVIHKIGFLEGFTHPVATATNRFT